MPWISTVVGEQPPRATPSMDINWAKVLEGSTEAALQTDRHRWTGGAFHWARSPQETLSTKGFEMMSKTGKTKQMSFDTAISHQSIIDTAACRELIQRTATFLQH